MPNKISNERKIVYYAGIGMIVFGVILFFSVFFTGMGVMESDFSFGLPSGFKRAVIGMICMIAGSILATAGARGTAGSGIILDPEKAREDLKPFNSAKGEMINDVIENIDVVKNINHEQKEIIKVRCRNCGELNDEDAKFCKNCGGSMQ